MNLLKKHNEKKDYSQIIGEQEGILKYIEFSLLAMKAGESFKEEEKTKETALIILSGKCSIKGKGFEFKNIGSRSNVFEGKPYSLYLPAGTSYEIKCENNLEIAICKAPSDLKSEIKLITPEEVIHKSLGKDNWQRDAYIILDERIKAKYLFIGEAIVPPGNWASFPPHRHEFDNLPEEVAMEEMYFFRFNPPQGFGIQRIYTDDRSIDETYSINNNDTVLIPRGYHPLVTAPGYSLYYLWVMAGEKRKFITYVEPAHRFITS